MNEQIGTFGAARQAMEHDWKYCRVLRGGTRALWEAGAEFTPMTARELDDLTGTTYQRRLLASTLYDVYGETVSRIAAMPFESPPVVAGELGPQMQKLVNDADRMGSSLGVFASSIYEDAIDRGLGCFLVDNIPTGIEETTVDEQGNEVRRGTTLDLVAADRLDARPYFSRLDPDSLIGWTVENRNGKEVCVELRVREWSWGIPEGSTREQSIERIRRYTETTVELWERVYSGSGVGSGFRMIEQPRAHQFPNDEIPLVVFYTNRRGFLFARPPMLGLAHLNLKHWNQQSVFDSALRYCLSPTLFGRGVDQEDKESPPRTGEGSRLLTTNQQAELRYVEIAGSSLEIGRKEIEKTEQRMRAAAVEPLRQGVATATGEMRAESREQSPAQRWIEGMEWALFRAFRIAESYGYEKLPPDFNLSLQRSSSLLRLATPQRTQSLQWDADKGYITPETYLKERARSGDYSDDFDPIAEAARVQERREQDAQRQMEALIESERRAAEAAEPATQQSS